MSPHVRFGGRQTTRGFRFELTGGRLELDFANTRDERETDHPRELLPAYSDLLNWGVQAGALARADAVVLRAHAARHAGAASSALKRARMVREAIFSLFSAMAAGRAAPAGALAVLNRAIRRAAGRRSLERRAGRFVWTWRPAGAADLDAVLRPVVWSAAELLASSDLGRVRRCEGAGCAWLFLDQSRSGTRCWCDMSVCGNRAKARRFYMRTRPSQA